MVRKFNRFIDALAFFDLNPFLVHSWEKFHHLGCYYLNQWACHYRLKRNFCQVFASLALIFLFVCLFSRGFSQEFAATSATRSFFVGLQKVSILIFFISSIASICFLSRPHPMLEQFRQDLIKLEEYLNFEIDKLEGATPKILKQHFDPIIARFRKESEELGESEEKRRNYAQIRRFFASFGYQEEGVESTAKV